MQVAFGLGNPGGQYEGTRHNLGREVVGSLVTKLGLRITAGKGEFLYSTDRSRDLCLVIPTTYVNTSGRSARQVVHSLGIDLGSFLVVCDDISLPLGTIRIRKSGSDGGHNGLASIIYELASQDFPRLRIGVGPVPADTDPADFVLSAFSPDEVDAVGKVTAVAGEAVLTVAADGIDKAMNIYNRRTDAQWR